MRLHPLVPASSRRPPDLTPPQAPRPCAPPGGPPRAASTLRGPRGRADQPTVEGCRPGAGSWGAHPSRRAGKRKTISPQCSLVRYNPPEGERRLPALRSRGADWGGAPARSRRRGSRTARSTRAAGSNPAGGKAGRLGSGSFPGDWPLRSDSAVGTSPYVPGLLLLRLEIQVPFSSDESEPFVMESGYSENTAKPENGDTHSYTYVLHSLAASPS